MVNPAREPNLPRMLQSSELILPLSDLSHLFNAPPQVDPSSPSPAEVLGTSGVDYALSLLHLNKLMQRDTSTLALLLPPRDAQAATPQQVQANLRRLIDFRIERERRELRNTYRYGWKVAGIAFIALALCLGMSSLFSSQMTENMRPLLRKTLEYGFEIVGWVMLWHPIDVLGYTPLAIRSRIRAMEALGAMEVVIRTQEPAGAAVAAPAVNLKGTAGPQVFA
jgi:hypothetical protein